MKSIKEEFNDSDGEVGELGAFLVIFTDRIFNGIISLINKLFQMSSKQGLTLLRDSSIDKKVYKHGTIYNYVYTRYVATILVPPLGIFLSKGLYGWINILICFLFCYINYFIGIGYALIITYNSKYADLYEKKQADDIKRIKYNLSKSEKAYLDSNKGELLVMCIFMGILVGIFLLVIYFK